MDVHILGSFLETLYWDHNAKKFKTLIQPYLPI